MRSILYIVADPKKIKVAISDGAAEFVSAFTQLGIVHRQTLPGRPESNSLIERQVQVLARGARALLAASGLPMAFWVYAAQCFCHLRNIQSNELGGFIVELAISPINTASVQRTHATIW